MSAALRTVGLCASVTPIPQPMTAGGGGVGFPPASGRSMTMEMPPIVLTPKDSSRLTFKRPRLSLDSVSDHPVVPTSSGYVTPGKPTTAPPGSPSMLPQLTLRRLWAPNDGRIKVPPPPTPVANRYVPRMLLRFWCGKCVCLWFSLIQLSEAKYILGHS